jgi:EAL and modified HD-GYP domain-containing signal transduction protein
MDQLYIGRQPILDQYGDLFAYELLYRANEDTTHAYLPQNQRTASIHVLNAVTKQMHIEEVLDNRLGFIKVDRAFLLHDFIFNIPKEHFVLAVLDSVEIDTKLEERLHELFKAGYKLAVNDMSLSRDTIQKFRPVFHYFSYAKFSTNVTINDMFKKLLLVLQMFDVELIATKVEDKEGFRTFKELGANYFQGFYFSKPELLQTKKVDPQLSVVMKLFSMLQSDTSSLDAIQELFEQNPVLTLKMLKILNSPLFALDSEVSNILQALTLIGRQPLSDWLLLLVYSKGVTKDSNSNAVLLKTAKQRSILLTTLLKQLYPSYYDKLKESATFLGIVSLYDALFNNSFEQVFKELPLAQEIQDALLHFKGILGELFEVVLAVESFDTTFMTQFAEKNGCEAKRFTKMVIDAMQTASEVERVIL